MAIGYLCYSSQKKTILGLNDLSNSLSNSVNSINNSINNLNTIVNTIDRLIVTQQTTLSEIVEWMMNKFQTGIRSLNIFQGEKIVIFDQTGNFNIICNKFIDGDQFTGIAINHWTRDTYSVGIDSSRNLSWKRLATTNELHSNEVMRHIPFNDSTLNSFNIDSHGGNWISGFTETGQGTLPYSWWQNIIQFDSHHFRSQLSILSHSTSAGIPVLRLRSWWGSNWTNWYKIPVENEIPVFETFVGDPAGKNYIEFTLSNNTKMRQIFAMNGDSNAFGGYVKGTYIVDGTNKLKVLLSEYRSGNIRINVMYLKA